MRTCLVLLTLIPSLAFAGTTAKKHHRHHKAPARFVSVAPSDDERVRLEQEKRAETELSALRTATSLEHPAEDVIVGEQEDDAEVPPGLAPRHR